MLFFGCATPVVQEKSNLTPPPEPELAVKHDSKEQAQTLKTRERESAMPDTEIINLSTEKEEKPKIEKPVVLIETNMGNIKVELDIEKAPVTVENFIKYIKKGFYKNTIFHRVIPDFMIQGGGFTSEMQRKPTALPIKNEAFNGLKNNRGTIAMARTNRVDSATSQFFINVKDNNFLDHKDHSAQRFGYCVFGKVIDGMDVVDKIDSVKTGQYGYFRDVPVKSVIIKDIKLLNRKDLLK